MNLFSRLPKWTRAWLFPLGMCMVYCFAMLAEPAIAHRALDMSVALFRQIGRPIFMALAVMILLNRFLSPVSVSRFMGKSSGLRGMALSTLAGIVSMGPLYAWYPLFKALRERGASVFHVANFMACRSIKPVFLPVLIAYFGMRFTILFLLANLVGAWLVAWGVHVVCAGRALALEKTDPSSR